MGMRGSVTSMGVAAVLGLSACNGLAGLDAFHEVDHYADASSDSDPDGPTVDGGGNADAAEAPESAPGCYELTVEVGASASGQYTGVSEKNGLLPVIALHERRTACLAYGTRVELHAEPGDPSSGQHTWTGPCAGTSRRCLFTMTQTTMVHVELE